MIKPTWDWMRKILRTIKSGLTFAAFFQGVINLPFFPVRKPHIPVIESVVVRSCKVFIHQQPVKRCATQCSYVTMPSVVSPASHSNHE